MEIERATKYPILYRDEWLIIIDKPSGVLSHPNPIREKDRLAGKKSRAAAFVGDYDFDQRRFDTPAGPVWLIHRLDQDASGVLLAAFDRDSAQKCRQLFETREIQKKYYVLVAGRPHPPRDQWRDHIAEKRERHRVRAFISRGWKPNAELRYETKQNFPKVRLALLEIELITGKTHQIRVQSAYHRNPVAGDEIYGNFALNRSLKKEIGLRRLFLHASAMIFKHPRTGEPLCVQAPLPAELAACLKKAG